MGVPYEVEVLPFPPRMFQREYLSVNSLGTVPYFVDGETHMTESSAICHYLVEKYPQTVEKHPQSDLGLSVGHPEYGDYLNWLYHSDATLTFPQTIVMRYTLLEPPERQQLQVVEDYRKWFIARLRRLDAHIEHREFLCDGRFTIADIAIGYALHLGDVLGLSSEYSPQVHSYLHRLRDRPAFKRAQPIGEDQSPFK